MFYSNGLTAGKNQCFQQKQKKILRRLLELFKVYIICIRGHFENPRFYVPDPKWSIVLEVLYQRPSFY